MNNNFNRRYKLIIVNHDSILQRIQNGRIFDSGLRENFLTEKRKSIVFSEHQMKADIDYTRKSKNGLNGPAVIKLYNISDQTLNRIKQNNTLILKAGYVGEELPIIFSGTIKDIDSKRLDDGNLETKIVCLDSINIANSLRISGFAPPATTYGDLIQDILNLLARNGLPTGNFDRNPTLEASDSNPIIAGGFTFYQQGIIDNITNPTTRTFINGRSYEGTALGELSKICEEINYKFYISLGKVYVEPNFNLLGAVRRSDFITITEDLLKKPINPNKSSSGKGESEGDKEGIRIQTFLNGRIRISLSDLDLNVLTKERGTYSISSVKHILDYEGADWDTIAILKRR